MTHTDTRTETVDVLLKRNFTEVAYFLSDEDVETCKLVAATARALAAERDTLSKRSEDIAEKYSQLADKYAKAVDEVIELKKQLAPRQTVQEAARVLLDAPRSTTGPMAYAGRVAEELLEDVECGGEITTEIIESFLRALAHEVQGDA